jgi:hypothetical protein
MYINIIGPAGAVDGASFYDLATYASYPYNDYPALSLSDGGLTAGEHVWSDGVSNNSSPGFIGTSGEPPNPALVYCAVVCSGSYFVSDNPY